MDLSLRRERVHTSTVCSVCAVQYRATRVTLLVPQGKFKLALTQRSLLPLLSLLRHCVYTGNRRFIFMGEEVSGEEEGKGGRWRWRWLIDWDELFIRSWPATALRRDLPTVLFVRLTLRFNVFDPGHYSTPMEY
jgi:hypothetical protein